VAQAQAAAASSEAAVAQALEVPNFTFSSMINFIKLNYQNPFPTTTWPQRNLIKNLRN
jgi:hypothetical protein